MNIYDSMFMNVVFACAGAKIAIVHQLSSNYFPKLQFFYIVDTTRMYCSFSGRINACQYIFHILVDSVIDHLIFWSFSGVLKPNS